MQLVFALKKKMKLDMTFWAFHTY